MFFHCFSLMSCPYCTVYLAPAMPSNVTYCGERNKTSLCVSWMKPYGGDAVDNYTLEWMRQNSSDLESRTMKHDSSNEFFYNIERLMPGEKVNVSVTAKNVVGAGKSATLYSASSNVHLIFILVFPKLMFIISNKNSIAFNKKISSFLILIVKLVWLISKFYCCSYSRNCIFLNCIIKY